MPLSKICGITTEQDILIVNTYKPAYAGFVFFEKSKRNLSMEKAKTLLEKLSDDVKAVAVTVSPTAEFVKELCEMKFDVLQIHGEITADVLAASTIPVWQAVNIDGECIPNVLRDEKITGYVVDGAKYGGGKTFGWENPDENTKNLVAAFRGLKQTDELCILAGGLTVDNLDAGITLFEPDVCDVSSGVEGEIGKDEAKVSRFIEIVKERTTV